MTVQELRAKLNLSVKEFADELCVTRQSVYLWEKDGKAIDCTTIHPMFRIKMRTLAGRKVGR